MTHHFSSVDKACAMNYPSSVERQRCVMMLSDALVSSGYGNASNPIAQNIISGACHKNCRKKDGSIGEKCFMDCVIAGNIAFSAGEPLKEGFAYHSGMSSRLFLGVVMCLLLLAGLVWYSFNIKK